MGTPPSRLPLPGNATSGTATGTGPSAPKTEYPLLEPVNAANRREWPVRVAVGTLVRMLQNSSDEEEPIRCVQIFSDYPPERIVQIAVITYEPTSK